VSIYQTQFHLGRGVVEFEPEGRAAEEITALITWAFTQIDLKCGRLLADGRQSNG
jgi:hypothetical protein